ncbi:hypothetical protein RZ760_008855 [Providencia rettgeri]|uniref:hypothetical protein n=1 Tax=Providencia stuartii TaxID=588 RepID=UPI00292980DB|nr:hypothetical protein [Providencia rettgeri]
MSPLILQAGAAVAALVSTVVLKGAIDRANNVPDYSLTKSTTSKNKYIPIGMPMPEGWDEVYEEYLAEMKAYETKD